MTIYIYVYIHGYLHGYLQIDEIYKQKLAVIEFTIEIERISQFQFNQQVAPLM